MLYYHILIWFFKWVLWYKTHLKSHICYEIRLKISCFADVLLIYYAFDVIDDKDVDIKVR
ncbi:hypothetical protein HMPREF0379_0412 [[Eubacterium] yurii subsp. margaretiae ATCC 43715]|nr:hypothetical protein HMPREF0379_0412 [[Eubacterium] yurii subsp. margaretiae ATCC 43715]